MHSEAEWHKCVNLNRELTKQPYFNFCTSVHTQKQINHNISKRVEKMGGELIGGER